MASASEEVLKSETPTTEGTESESDAEQTVAPNKALAETDGEGRPSSPPGDLNTADDLMDSGSKAYNDRNFAEAVDCFKRALAIRVNHYGEFSPQCTHAYISYGIALLCELKIPIGDDLMTSVPKEADYQHHFDKDGSISAAKEDGNQIHSDRDADGGAPSKEHEIAWNQLNIARSIIRKQLAETEDRLCILKAVGEVAFQGEELNSEKHLEAILGSVVEGDCQCIPNLFFIICECLERYSKTEAIAYCERAISLCQTRLKWLMDELKSSSKSAETSTASELNQESSSAPAVDPYIQQKKAEIDTLTGLSINLERKIEDVRKSLISPPTLNPSGNPERTSTEATPTATSSGNLERTYTEATSNAKCSTQMSATNHCEVPEFDSASTSHIDVAGGVVGGNESMRQPSTDSAIEKGDRSPF